MNIMYLIIVSLAESFEVAWVCWAKGLASRHLHASRTQHPRKRRISWTLVTRMSWRMILEETGAWKFLCLIASQPLLAFHMSHVTNTNTHSVKLKLLSSLNDILIFSISDGTSDCSDSECCTHGSCSDHIMCLASNDPVEVLLRKQPPSVTASFYQRVKFLIEENSVQAYAHLDEYSERWVISLFLLQTYTFVYISLYIIYSLIRQ